MQWFANLRLRAKLMVAFAIVVCLTAIMGVFSISRLAGVNEQANVMAQHWMTSSRLAGSLNTATGDFRVYELLYVNAAESERANLRKQLQAHAQEIEQLQSAYAKLIEGDQERQLWDSFKADWLTYTSQHARILTLADEHKQADAIAMTQAGEALYEKVGHTLDELIAFNTRGAQTASEAGDRMYVNARVAIIVAVLLVALLGAGLALVVSGQVSAPVASAAGVLKAVAQGDLTQVVEVNRRDEIGDMQAALRDMMHSLTEMVHAVRAGADSVATASTQIAQGNTDLSARTETQASSLEETAASVEEMAGTVRTNADNAMQANQLASAASEVAAHGGQVVGQVVSTMNDIQASSRKIADIIGVIDGIAFQTNILALNAAVEAARAGEQGRGFAVVAGEVRSLAQRSAQAAREIKTLIQDSVEKVNAGGQLVDAAGATMNDVVTQVRKVTDLVGEIAHASAEQSQGISQINQAVSQLDQATQQNAALVEESMAAAESLRSQAQKLTQAVAAFRIRSSHQPVVRASAAPLAALTPVPAAPARSRAASPAPKAMTPSSPLTLPVPKKAEPEAVAAATDDWETF
jgi:methyl-accepting chemotaxis protein